MKFFALFCLLALLSVGCGSSGEDTAGVSPSSELLRKNLAQELSDAGIEYETDKDGFIRYPEKYQRIVQSLLLTLSWEMRQEEDAEHGFEFADKNVATSFMAYLDKNGINTRELRYSESSNRVSWPRTRDETIKRLFEQFLNEYAAMENDS